MTNLTVYQTKIDVYESLENFLNLYHGNRMHVLASDLLKEGFSTQDIINAVRQGMVVCRTARLPINQHFQLVYTQLNGALVRDCKLSDIGYALVILNGPPNHPLVAGWQMKLVKEVLEGRGI